MLGWIRLQIEETSNKIVEGVNIQINKSGDIFIESLPGYKGSDYDAYEQYILEKRRGQYE